ncbi:MAG TPA: serine/threonine-protein kinase [Blastocatellia bacterium]|nr:serine/threonine-protein kinase [Blastocatellia bacterium]
MRTCSSCSNPVLAGAFFCAACGAAQTDSKLPPTVLAERPDSPAQPGGDPGRNPDALHHRLPSGPSEVGIFIAGAMLARRYRIVGLLGKGGMGEVYKAEDLKLEQTVALKFLPAAIALEGGMLARFHNEVRVARQVSHPAVCRVYDIGEVDGRHFLSMEFIDGEDMSTLLRRIGRVPGDKAVELARQICAGLAAAHDLGVLHRDLKPANIMIDGRGKARITDFGLAVVAEELRSEDVLVGTPAYMAPEQLAGKEVTRRSDIYALGLVLYELFTGKRVFEAKSIHELIGLHEKSIPVRPSSYVKELDPQVESAIIRCLEKDPKARPASAIEVSAALPGGDPLAAALAAGETPSPEMVAAAGEKTGLRPQLAVSCLVAITAGLLIIAFLGSKASMAGRMRLDNPPDVLAHKAREILSRLGYADRPLDTAYGFVYDDDYLRYVRGRGASRLLGDRSAAIQFWYRESPQYLEADFIPGLSGQIRVGRITPSDPPPVVSGMVSAVLDPQGRLIAFSAVPPQLDESSVALPVDWAALFSAADLEATRYTPAEPQWTPLAACDARAAWTGPYPEQPEIPLRIEMAAYRGHPVYFQMIGPWARPSRMPAVHQPGKQRALYGGFVTTIIAVTLGAALLARRNVRLGRGDRRGAFRLGFFVFSLILLAWLFGTAHAPTVREGEAYLLAISQALFVGVSAGLFYLALEPYVRRRWPQTLIAWSRIMEGRLRDPVVGRDLLVGILFAICTMAIVFLISWVSSASLVRESLYGVLGVRQTVALFLTTTAESIINSAAMFFLIFLLRILLRNQWLAAGVPILFLAAVIFLLLLSAGGNPVLGLLGGGVVAALYVVALVRFGLIALLTLYWTNDLLGSLPLTIDPSAWYAGNTTVVITAVLALAVFAFYTSLGGQRVFQGKLLES